MEDETFNEKASQTDVINVEMQTDYIESDVFVKWGRNGQFPLPPGTAKLMYGGSFNLEVFPLDYPVMTSPATWVLHPVWGLGKHQDDDGEHFYYRLDGKEIHAGGKKK